MAFEPPRAARLTFRGGHAWRLAACVAVALSASPAWAQSTSDDATEPDSEATVRLGPLSMKPAIALNDVGIDTNVFNEADNPQRDFTMTFSPVTDMWLRLGRTWISGRIDVDWVYYQTFTSERSTNADLRVGISRTLNRLVINGNAKHLSTRERPGFEIDARSDRVENELDGSVEMRLVSNTYVGARAWRRQITFDGDEVFRGTNLAEELNRTIDGHAFTIRRVLTPLTTVSVEVGRERERFLLTPLRDADSNRIAGTATFQPFALIHGTATAGYRRFTPLAADVPAYRGATAAVSLAYTLMGMTRFGVEVSRDVQPSLEFEQPYYLETGLAGQVQQQVVGPFDVLARAGTRRLAYRDRAGIAPEISNRTDRVRMLTFGTGYRFGSNKRIGFAIERQRRTSSVDGRQYRGLRFGVSLTYET